MNRQDIIAKLAEILSEEQEDESMKNREYTEDMGLYTDLGLNSIGLLYTVISVEEAFDIRFENMKMTDFATIGDVVNYVEKALAAK
ncbi:MAG: phosphopantetheine-binding protein [Lachnospiraceae bacterium]|nr:phosphopantetheine-binding protein [Lachnospiraceae bacterium]